MIQSLKQNWKIYSMEAVCLGLFMVSASFFATVLEYPNSVLHQALQNDFLRLVIMGAAMGITATAIIYSPMGKLSGAQMNPAVTFTFYGLKKMKINDAIFYALFQCVGGTLAVLLMRVVLGDAFADAHVNYVVTAPGKYGPMAAFIVEIIIAFGMMMMILITSNNSMTAKYTGVVAGFFVMAYVILSGPISGFSINPARSIASAIPSGHFNSFWIYVTAPFIGMFSAAACYQYFKGVVHCAKMHHSKLYKCIFNCSYCDHEAQSESSKA
jgi:aquaporin Z